METYQVKRPAALDLNSWDHEFHNVMLGDTVRMDAFKVAIQSQVKQGDVVVDLGTGTGILAKIALEAGASKVYGIEFKKDILDVAKRDLKEFGDRFVPILGNSLNVELPERVDVIISETIGNFADNENCVLFLKDAKKRFLKDGGIMIPNSVIQMMAPVSVPIVQEKIDQMDSLNYYETVIPKEDYVSKPAEVNEFVFDQDEEVEYSKSVIFHIERDVKITGFKGWFIAGLTNSFVLDTEVVKEDSSWNHFYVPCEVDMSKGDMLKIYVKKHGNDYQIISKKI
jgi:protein arginine N-methyltransferase 1